MESIFIYVVMSAFSAFPVLQDHFTPTHNFYLEKVWGMPDIDQNNSTLPRGGAIIAVPQQHLTALSGCQKMVFPICLISPASWQWYRSLVVHST